VLRTLDELIRRNRRHLAIVAFTLMLAGAVVAAHSEPGDDHMGGAATACMAVLETAALVILSGLGLAGVCRRPGSLMLAAPRLPATVPVGAARCPQQARAGPQSLNVLRR
jgi:hypothetical protein